MRLFLVVLILYFSSTTLGLVRESLIPDMEEVKGSLAQIMSSISSGSTLQMREAYQQLESSETLLIQMRDQIQNEQSKDRSETVSVETAIIADLTALQVNLENSKLLRGQQGLLVDKLNSMIGQALISNDTLKSDIEGKQSELSDTESECQSLKDLYNARAVALRNDILITDQLFLVIEKLECNEGNFVLLQKLSSAATSLSSFRAQSQDISVLLSSEVSPLCDCLLQSKTETEKKLCNCAPTVPTYLHNKDAVLSCNSRKSAVRDLVKSLQDQLYSSASQDDHTFEENYRECSRDLELKKNTIDSLTIRVEIISHDIQRIQSELSNLNSEISIINSTIIATEDDISLLVKKQQSVKCRFDKRTEMRDKQLNLINEILKSLEILNNSSYSSYHQELRSGCKNNCSDHGFCFNKKCECNRDWAGEDCSRSKISQCPFKNNSLPCQFSECSGVDFTNIPSYSNCSTIVCDYCRINQFNDDQCLTPQTSLFCADFDRKIGCDQSNCPILANNTNLCGLKRIPREPFIGCCFNPILDCQDECASVVCTNQSVPRCENGLAVRSPYAGCCFNPKTDCVDRCSNEVCGDKEISCPSGKVVRHPFAGCCFSEKLDCEDSCQSVICDQSVLPVDSCRQIGKRWTGDISGCCFNPETDCSLGDDSNQSNERFALESLYNGTNGNEWTRKDNRWMTASWICFWPGIECSGIPGEMYISAISLATNNLVGTIPHEIVHFKSILSLDISGNQIYGTIPTEFSQLSTIQSLKINNNQLNGEVPKGLLSLPQLVILDLRYNFLTGKISEQVKENISLNCEWNCMCDNVCPNRRSKTDPFNENGIACDSCPQ